MRVGFAPQKKENSLFGGAGVGGLAFDARCPPAPALPPPASTRNPSIKKIRFYKFVRKFLLAGSAQGGAMGSSEHPL